MEVFRKLDDDTGPLTRRRPTAVVALIAFLAFLYALGHLPAGSEQAGGQVTEDATVVSDSGVAGGEPITETAQPWYVHMPPWLLVSVVLLLACSAFFSSSETALFSLHKLRVRSMRGEDAVSGKLIAQLLDSPGEILTTILVGNMIVNVSIGVILGTHVEDLFRSTLGVRPALAYVLAVAVTTGVLVLLGEIGPKIVAVSASESLARAVAFPLMAVNAVLAPLRDLLLRITDGIFRVFHFSQLHAAPFITDEELRALLTQGESEGVIEEEERQMIQGILEFTDAMLREILVPRPDIVAIPEGATVREALDVLREHQYSRMPVFREDMDHLVGLLVGKDLLPSVARGDLDKPIKSLIRPLHFVPETMTVQAFVKDAQRHRAHLAIVVDEYGGTAGMVTLEDAMEQVVGDIMDEGEFEEPEYELVGENVYRVDGGFNLDDLSDLIGVKFEDESHETVAGFLMHQTEKIPEVGDTLEYSNVVFTIEEVEGRRASAVRVVLRPTADVQEPT